MRILETIGRFESCWSYAEVSNTLGKIAIFSSTIVSALVIFVFIGVLTANSWPALSQVGSQLFTLEWYPPGAKFGILSMLYGSAIVTLIALLVAVPLGIMSAIYISEILDHRYKLVVKSLIEILAGIPSIIYGLIGIALFSVWIGDFFDLQSGRTLLCAGVLLGIMVLPTIITLSDDALSHVPQEYRDAAKGLGLYPYEVIKDAVLPIAKGGVIGAVLLAFGRALGETMAVMLVIGSIDKIPGAILNVLVPGQTITSKLGREIAEASFGSLHFSALVFMGLVLLLIVLALTSVSLFYSKTESRLNA